MLFNVVAFFLQIEHTGWEEDDNIAFYSNYIHIAMSKDGVDPITLSVGQEVQKGDLITYSYETSTLEHIHFEIRVGGSAQRHCCNPWKYLPNDANDYTSFNAFVYLTPNYKGINCEAVVNVSVPPDQLTFNRIELHIVDVNDVPQPVQFFDMCGANSNHSFDHLDQWEYKDDPEDNSSYTIRISPMKFNRLSYGRHEPAQYGFEFIDLPVLTGGKVMAKVIDVFDNSRETTYMAYTCTNPTVPSTGNLGNTRNDRVWPIGGTTNVSLGQSSPFGPQVLSSGRYRNVIIKFHTIWYHSESNYVVLF